MIVWRLLLLLYWREPKPAPARLQDADLLSKSAPAHTGCLLLLKNCPLLREIGIIRQKNYFLRFFVDSFNYFDD